MTSPAASTVALPSVTSRSIEPPPIRNVAPARICSVVPSWKVALRVTSSDWSTPISTPPALTVRRQVSAGASTVAVPSSITATVESAPGKSPGSPPLQRDRGGVPGRITVPDLKVNDTAFERVQPERSTEYEFTLARRIYSSS